MMNDDEKGNMWIDLGVVGRDMGKGGGEGSLVVRLHIFATYE